MRSIALFGSLLLVLLAQSVSLAAGTLTGPHEHFQQSSGIAVNIDFGNGTNLTYIGLQASDALTATQAVAQVELKWYGDLVFVLAIDDVPNDASSGLWWQYWVDGELAPVAANKYQLQDNDSIQWRRAASQYGTNPTGPADLSVLFGAGAIGALGSAFLVILYRRKSRGQ